MGLVQNLYLAGVCIFSEAVGPAGVLRACWVIGRFLLMLPVGKETLASAPQEAPGTQMKVMPKPIYLGVSAWCSVHVHVFSCLLVCVICNCVPM